MVEIAKDGQKLDELAGLFLEQNIDKNLGVMRAEAQLLGVTKGVGFIAISPFHKNEIIIKSIPIKLERAPDLNRKGDIGTNYFGVAMQKLASMLATGEDSGSNMRPVKNGETTYRGGLVMRTAEGSCIYAGFSGGTEDQDVQIAYVGLYTLVDLAEKHQSNHQ